jgi:hypothetical protein
MDLLDECRETDGSDWAQTALGPATCNKPSEPRVLARSRIRTHLALRSEHLADPAAVLQYGPCGLMLKSISRRDDEYNNQVWNIGVAGHCG